MTVTETPSTDTPAAPPLKDGRVVAIAGPVVNAELPPAGPCRRSTWPCR